MYICTYVCMYVHNCVSDVYVHNYVSGMYMYGVCHCN